MARAVRLVGGNIEKLGTIANLGTVGNIARVNDVSIKAFPCPKINDKGLTGAWWWIDKIAMAVTIWATTQAYKAAKEEYEIGKRYYNLARETWDFFYTYYRPLEDQELDEIFAETEYKPNYGKATDGHTGLVDVVFSKAENHRTALADKYCVCNDIGQFVKSDIMKSTVYGDSDNFARRYEEKLTQEKNDIRWSRRLSAAGRGRNILTQSAQFASRATSFLHNYANAMGGLASNSEQFRGYINNRYETIYNADRQRIDGMAHLNDYVRQGETPIYPTAARNVDASAVWGIGGVNEAAGVPINISG